MRAPLSFCKSDGDGDEDSEEHAVELSASSLEAGKNVRVAGRPENIRMDFLPSNILSIDRCLLLLLEGALLRIIVVGQTCSLLATLIALQLALDDLDEVFI